MNAPRKFLLIAAVGLTPIALSYGYNPQASLKYLFDISIQSINDVHIFRAIMGLYCALIVYWVIGAMFGRLTGPALYSLVVFMLGLAAGRTLSIVIDGVPHWILTLYLVLEVLFGMVGILMIRNLNKTESKK